jgi:hypothetical protein
MYQKYVSQIIILFRSMTKLLFICGFNTHPEEQNDGNITDIYCAFNIYFQFSNYEVDYFRYKTTEDLFDVYQRLNDILDTKKHDLVITHSMGSCLAMKYIHETQDKRHYVMCMPFVHTSTILKLLSNIPFIQYLYLPKCCVLPNNTLVDGGNILNDEMKPISCNQLQISIQHFFLPDEQLVETINSNNIHIIYAKNESVSQIDSKILDQIKTEKKTFSNGKHVSFSNSYHMSNFFEILTNILTLTNIQIGEPIVDCKNNQLRKRRAL